jgi:hypothetical protein
LASVELVFGFSNFCFKINIDLPPRTGPPAYFVAPKQQQEEDDLGGSSSGIVRDHIQQFEGGSSRPMAVGSRAPTNRDAETQTTTETHDAESLWSFRFAGRIASH